MPDEMDDILEDEKKITKLREIGALAEHESLLLFRQALFNIYIPGKEMGGEELIDAYHKGVSYALVRFWEMYCENHAEIHKEILENQEELMRKIN